MTQENKQLLLKDLSARLPYGVIVNYKEGEYDFHKWKIETLYAPEYSETGLLIETNCDGWIGYTEYTGCGISSASRALHLDKNLPYLRPMSSMTEEECVILSKLIPYEKDAWKYIKTPVPLFIANIEQFDLFHRHHLDWRGLIPMGLALEAPEGMYKNNK